MRSIVIALAVTPLLSACWFVWIPGGLIQAAADGITGAEGEHCVPRTTKVGDRMALPTGVAGEVKSLSGESSRCREPGRPIRARIE